MAIPKIHTRVITKKGKDVVKMLDGRWATVLSENETHIEVETVDIVYSNNFTGRSWHTTTGLHFYPTGDMIVLNLDKRIVEDKRAEILKARAKRA